MYCIEGVCDNADDPPDTGLAAAVTALEIARQSSAYADFKTRTIFNGEDDRCSRKLFGLISCCGSRVKANTASSLLRVNNVYGATVPESIPLVGSAYTHDPLYQNGLVPSALMNQLYGEGASAYGNLDVFGITWTTGVGFAFDPIGFSVSVAANMTADLLSCTKDEQLLSLKKGDDLCHYVGTYCDSRSLIGGCVTKKDTYCCFNSVLAKIINEQGRAQLGRDWGTPESPQCKGFSFDDLGKLDFSVMDFSEFEAQIQTRQQNRQAVQQRARDQAAAINNAPAGSYFEGPGSTGQCTPPNCPP
jgi:conjugal transfer mating pair stabilization protein TraN